MESTLASCVPPVPRPTATACTSEVPRTSSKDPEYVAIDVTSKMGVLDEATCVELLESTPIGRIGFSTDGELLVLPINYRWYEHSVVFRTLEGHKLAAAAEQQHVCFEVDHWDADTRTGWSVVVQGVARDVTHWAERPGSTISGSSHGPGRSGGRSGCGSSPR